MINEVIMRIDPTLADEFEKLDSTSAQFRQKEWKIAGALGKSSVWLQGIRAPLVQDVDFFSI